jgi:hypothetical protein
MSESNQPRPYDEWRSDPTDRAEDAAYTFGADLIMHCRAEALKKIGATQMPTNSDELRTVVEKSVDTALHNVLDLLEGFRRTDSGPNHRVEYALSVCVKDAKRSLVERIDISPSIVGLTNWLLEMA